jgi:acyl-coenzyme A thioesterase PaaI-like protein
VDYDALRAGYAQAIPFNGHVGLEVTEVADGRGVVLLPDEDYTKNHVGSQHAGALFSAGEAASGGAFIGAFAEHMGGITPLAKSADIDYLKLAKGPITATGTLSEDKASLIERLESEQRVEFPIEVSMADENGTEVARMTVHWHVRKNS